MQATEDPIGHLDFEPAIDCEHNQHTERHDKEAAALYVRGRCPHCQVQAEYFLCRSGWRVMEKDSLECEHCKKEAPRNDAMKIIDIVKGY